MQAMKNIFSYTLLGLLNLLVVLGVTSYAGAAVKPPALPNFHLVAAGIYRGGAPTTQGLSTLKTMGIHTIIDLRISPHLVKQEKQRAQKLGFSWMNLPMGSEAPWRGRRMTRTSWQKYLPPNCAPTPKDCVSLWTSSSIARSRKAWPASEPCLGSES